MELRFTVPIYAAISNKKTVLVNMNWYRNAHFFQSNKVKKMYVSIISKQVASVSLLGKYRVHYNIYIKRKGTDGGNIRSVIEKFALDVLQELNVIKNDDFETIVGSSDDYYLDRDEPRCEIILTKQ